MGHRRFVAIGGNRTRRALDVILASRDRAGSAKLAGPGEHCYERAARPHGWRMTDHSTAIVAPLARWSCRIALFSASLLLVSLVLHRATSFSTAVAMNLFLVGYAGAAMAMLIGAVAFVQIWRTGFGGAASVAVGVLMPLLMFAGPVGYAVAFHNLPRINDVTTDLASPPKFVALAKRSDGANSSAYPGQTLRRPAGEGLSRPAHPGDRAFCRGGVRACRGGGAEAALAGRCRRAADRPAREGGDARGHRPDHARRVYGRHRHPRRGQRQSRAHRRALRLALRQLRFRAERQRACAGSSPKSRRARRRPRPASPAGAGAASARARALLKRQKAGDPEKAGSRTGRGPAQSNVQRAPAQKERQR